MGSRSYAGAAWGALLLLGAGCGDDALGHADTHAPLRQAAGATSAVEAVPPDAEPPAAAPPPTEHVPPPPGRAAVVTLASPDVTIRATTSHAAGLCRTGVLATLSRDAAELTAEYDFNEITMERDETAASGTCSTQIALDTSVPMQLSASRLRAQGFTDLGPGVTATADLSYAYGQVTRSVRRDFGPGESERFRIEEAPDEGGAAWSACSRRHVVSVRNVFTLRNGSPPGEGWLDMCSTLVGDDYSNVSLRLAWRACELPTAAQPSGGAP